MLKQIRAQKNRALGISARRKIFYVETNTVMSLAECYTVDI